MAKKLILVAATLKWCNERRKEKGEKPLDRLPRGSRNNGMSCPCGKACGFFVGRFEYFGVKAGVMQRTPLGILPRLVREFTERFDNGRFPEYDANITKP